MLSRRVREIGMSPTLRISALAQELRRSGVDVLDFSAGQPDFPTPEPVKQAGIRAIRENQTRYTANAGLLELRQAVADRILADHGLEYAADQILVSSGAKASLYFAFLALLDPGDQVLVPRPYWVSYPEQVRLAGGEPVFVPCHESNGFKLDAADLERARTPRTRALILDSPCNPTGACFHREDLEPVAEFCLRHGLWIVSDEIYSRLVFDGRSFVSIASLGDEVRARTVMINGVSKSYSMTGWRIGYAAATDEVISGMGRLQSHTTSNAASISQWASVEALRSSEDEVTRRVAEFQRRRDEVVGRLRELDGIECLVPEGSFYAFPNVEGVLQRSGGRFANGGGLAEYLLQEARVALVPGDAFGSPSHLRLSYAVSIERIREGMARIAEALAAVS